MKTKLMLASFLALAGVANAQNIFPPFGNAGIGTTSPAYPLDVQTSGTGGNGIRIKQNGSQGEATLRLNAVSAGGHEYALHSFGSGWPYASGGLVFYDHTDNAPRILIQPTTGNVGIGTTAPVAKLHVIGTTLGIKGDAGGNIGNIGVQGTGFFGVDGIGGRAGVRGQCYGSGNLGVTEGVRGVAIGGALNYGGNFSSSGSISGVICYGVYSEIFNPNLGSANYGIFSTVGGNNSLGLGPNYAGYFNGDVVTAGGSYFYSDGRLKKDITGINNSLNTIKKLNPVNYSFDLEGNKNLTLPAEKQYGFISQEVQEILPEFTKTLIHPAKIDEEGNEIYPKKEVLGLNYNGFIALLTKGIQEQQEQIEVQQKTIELQQQKIEALENKVSGTTGINNLNIETGFQMSQNEPNPFTHETVVKYTLPQTISNAFMAVYDLTGKQITTFPINEKGASSLTITSEKLAAGIYIYSIVADGKVVDSKRMIVAEK